MADQANVTNAIAAGVQNNAASTGPANAVANNNVNIQAPSSAPQGEGGFSEMLKAFSVNFAGGNYVQSQLNQKAQIERAQAEMKFKQKQEKEAADAQFILNGVKQYGSSFLKNPEMTKGLDPQEAMHYQVLGQAVDGQKKAIRDAATKLGHPEYADLPTELVGNILKAASIQQTAQQNDARNALATQGQQVTMRGQDMANQRSQADLSERYAALDQAKKIADDKLAEGGKAGEVVPQVNNSLQKLYKDYDPTTAKYTNQAALGAAKAHNQMVDAAEKKMKKVDPNANLDAFRVKVKGVDAKGNEIITRNWYTAGLTKSTTPISIVPWNRIGGGSEGASNAPVETGINAATKSTSGRSIIKVPVSPEYPRGYKYADK